MKPATNDDDPDSAGDVESAGFAPIAASSARVLILGSMPGQASLRAAEYYAHPRNAFWPIMGRVVGADPELDYTKRVAVLKQKGIAVWDVLARCRRVGSLDADIDPSSVVVNDFAIFVGAHAELQRVLFNGAVAEQLFRRHVKLDGLGRMLVFQRLPSTSPAHAGMRFEAKLSQWRTALLDDSDKP